MDAYFESKIGVTASRIWSFVPFLCAKITLKKAGPQSFRVSRPTDQEKKEVPSFVALTRSSRLSRTFIYAPNTLRLNKSWRHFLELTLWFQQYLISIQSVEVQFDAKKGRMSGENETVAKTPKKYFPPKFSVFLLNFHWKITATSLRITKFVEKKFSKKRTMNWK